MLKFVIMYKFSLTKELKENLKILDVQTNFLVNVITLIKLLFTTIFCVIVAVEFMQS